MNDFTLEPIGVVRSDVTDRKQTPALGGPARVEIFPPFADGLLQIEKQTHFWILGWLMQRPERDVLQVIPRGVDPASANALHGVFAVRSPARPNPVGLTAARLIRREGLSLYFDYLDFVDGTPVIDIKPYFVSRDLIFSATNRAIGRPRNREALVESLRYQAQRYAPSSHPDVELAVQIVAHFRTEALRWREPDQWRVEAPLHRPHLLDALVGITKVTFGNGLAVSDTNIVTLNDSVCYQVSP